MFSLTYIIIWEKEGKLSAGIFNTVLHITYIYQTLRFCESWQSDETLSNTVFKSLLGVANKLIFEELLS